MRRYGGPDVVEVRDVPPPAIGDDEALVEVHAASVNPIDFKVRSGKVRVLLRYDMPLVMGNDLSGVVVEVGRNVKRARPGDQIYARLSKTRIGAFAELAAVRDEDLARKPAELSYEEAASLPLVGLTAYQALIDHGRVGPGMSVLVHAGAGGLGTFAIQLAKRLGAKVATTCSTRNVELTKSLGADIAIDYSVQRFDEVLSGYDVVLDTLGGEALLRSFRVVKPGGLVVSVSGMPDRKFAKRWGLSWPLQVLFAVVSGRIASAAAAAGARYEFLFMEPSGRQLDEIRELVAQGAIKPVLDRVFPLKEAKQALAYSESGRARGKIVIRVR
jgi:NADPH:quinone reductase-like Zn-dependent oxidoreductase